jgi:hypothetical protein
MTIPGEVDAQRLGPQIHPSQRPDGHFGLADDLPVKPCPRCGRSTGRLGEKLGLTIRQQGHRGRGNG